MWYSWKSMDEFERWHRDTCVLLGLPKPGRNLATGEVEPDAQWTTKYTEPVFIADDDVRAFVEAGVASLSPNFIGLASESPFGSSDILDEEPS